MCYLDYKEKESGKRFDFSLMNLKESHIKIIKAGVENIYEGLSRRTIEYNEDYENRRAADELIKALNQNDNKDN